MSYIPTEWETGDVVTAEKLNKLENGVAGSGNLIVETTFHYGIGQGNVYFVTQTLAADIIEAITNGRNVLIHIDGYDKGLGVPSGYFTPIYIEKDDYDELEMSMFLVPNASYGGFGNLMYGKIDGDGYVRFNVYID